MNWKKLTEQPNDEASYLVCWLQADGKYSIPHRAYYVSDENKFFSMDTLHAHPLIVDIYMEIPKVDWIRHEI